METRRRAGRLMVMPLEPRRGGFLRPFGTGIFIREFLAGRGPQFGTVAIDPHRGAPQSDIHAAYKGALHRAMAEDMTALEVERRIRRGRPPRPEVVEELRRSYLERIPHKLTRMRYASFTTYFSHLKRLGYVEPTGQVEPSEFQEDYPDAQPRVYYRLTARGRAATELELSDPLMTLYHYPREVRSARRRHYFTPPAGRRASR